MGGGERPRRLLASQPELPAVLMSGADAPGALLGALVGLLAAAASLSCSRPSSAPPVDTAYTSMVEQILAAWNGADLVCLGEQHASTGDAALREALVRHPSFPAAVQVIVVEFANPVHQGLLDRLILSGEQIPRPELQRAWRDAGRGVVWELPQYESFLRTVQAVNRALPPPRRLRVVGGAAAIDWSAVDDAADLLLWSDRSALLAATIQREVLDRRLRGLAIFGAGHCERLGMGIPVELGDRDRARWWSIGVFEGTAGTAAARARFGLGDEARLLVMRGTKWANVPGGAMLFEGHAGTPLGDVFDALVYHGTHDSLLPLPDESALDADFRSELARRERLRVAAAQVVP